MFKYHLLFVLLAVLVMNAAFENQFDINSLRKEYVKAVEDANKNDSLLSALSRLKTSEPLLVAYKGACEGLRAKHAWNPYMKMVYLKQSKQTLAKAVSMAPSNVEIRFLRFSMEHYLPAFLGESRDLDDDRKVIVANLGSAENAKLGKQTLQTIGKFMLESGRCSPAEAETIRTVISGQ